MIAFPFPSPFSPPPGILSLYLEQASEDAARTGYVLELVEYLAMWLTGRGTAEAQRWTQLHRLPQEDRPLPTVEHCWTSTVVAIAPMCLNPDPRLRQASCLLLQQVLQSSDQLGLPWAAWEACVVSHVIPLASALVDLNTGRNAARGGARVAQKAKASRAVGRDCEERGAARNG